MNVIRNTCLARSFVQKQLLSLGTFSAPNFSHDFYARDQQKRSFSIESILKTQSGFFQSMSESTPVEYLQNFLVQVHDQSGLPWWATIICTTVFLRTTVTLPFAIYQQRILAKFENIAAQIPLIAEELKKEMHIAVRIFQWDERTAQYQYRRSIRKQWTNLIIRENCHPLKAGILLVFQIPLWVCYSISLRNLIYQLPKTDICSHVIFTELCVGGFSWIPNLIQADTSFILPVLLGLTNLAITEIQTLSRVKEPGRMQRLATNFFRAVSIGMIPIAASVPSCLALYWATSSTFGLAQNLVLMSPKVKRFFGIPLTKSELQQPYTYVLKKFKGKMVRVKKI